MRTTSTSGSTGAGLKKCIPTTRSGRAVAFATSVTESAEVFVASTASSDDHAVEHAEELLLGVELLDDRLDHEVAAGEVVELGRRRQPGERGVALLGGQPALLDAAAEVVGDPLARALAELLAHLAARPSRSPPATQTWAIPAPMVPRPTTPTFRTSAPPIRRDCRRFRTHVLE